MNEDNLINTPEIDYAKYKLLISSCLQKSLRRGRFDLAKPYIEFLWKYERNYITYRLATILSEDVGIANIDLVNRYLSTKIAKLEIDAAGGLNFILDIVEKACDSIKDRSSCDLGYLASYFSMQPEIYQLSEEDKLKSLSDIFFNKASYPVDRVNASWTILGVSHFPNDKLPLLENYPINEKNKKIDNVKYYLELCQQLGLENKLVQCIENSYLTQRENICLGMPIIQDLYSKELQEEKLKITKSKFIVGQTIEHTYVKEEKLWHPVLNMELISCGIDGHTREGKNAYYQYLKTNSDFKKYLYSKNIPYDQHIVVLSHCMFRIEGHEVNKRLYFPSAVNVMRDCEQVILDKKLGLGDKYLDFNHIKKLLLKDIDIINRLRLESIKNAEIPILEKKETKTKKRTV